MSASPPITGFATILLMRKRMLLEIVLPEKVYGQKQDASKRASIHLACVKLTIATKCVFLKIARR